MDANMPKNHICILGGTGFVGRHIAAKLSKAGHFVRILTRRRERHRDLLVLPNVQVVDANIHDPSVLEYHFVDFLDGTNKHGVVINLVGILNEQRRRGRRFNDAHVELPRHIIKACQDTGVRRLLHMSALKADHHAPSRYLRSKAEGEALVMGAEDIDATSFRPSVIFGPDDQFFNRFARLLALSPGVFPLACADARFAPVYVEDVAEAFLRAMNNPATVGHSYELCGPHPYTLHQLVAYTAQLSGHRRRLIDLGDRLSWLQGLILEHLPGQPFSRDNYLSTRVTSLCKSQFPAVFGIKPIPIEAIVPGYLGERDINTRLSLLRRSAGRD
jgi:NADH dehydrogenase